MRIYYDIRLSDRNITKRELTGEAIVRQYTEIFFRGAVG